MFFSSFGISDAYKELCDAGSVVDDDPMAKNILLDKAIEHLEATVDTQREKLVHEAALDPSLQKTWRKYGGLVRKLCPEKFKGKLQNLVGTIINAAGSEQKIIGEVCKCHNVDLAEYKKFMEEFKGDIEGLSKKMTPVLKAVFLNNFGMLKVLKDLGSDVNRIVNGSTPIITAIFLNSIEMVKLLKSLGADVNQSIEGIAAPVNIAMEHNSTVMMLLLKELGADIHQYKTPFSSPMGVALLENHSEMVTLLEKLGVKKAYVEDSIKSISLAHLWGIEGESTLADDDQTKVELEGATASYMMETLSAYVDEFFKSIDSTVIFKDQEVIKEALKTAFPLSSDSLEYIAKINAKKPVVILAGTDDHAVSMVIHNEKLIVCNRGYQKTTHSSEFYSLPISKVDEELINDLIATYPDMKPFNEMIADLGLLPLKEYSFSQSNQKVGNCTWASAKAAFLILLIFYTNNRETAKEIYKKFTSFAREKILHDYLKDSHAPDFQLIEQIKAKCNKKPELLASKKILENVPVSIAMLKSGQLDFAQSRANAEKSKKIHLRKNELQSTAETNVTSPENVEMQSDEMASSENQARKKRKS